MTPILSGHPKVSWFLAALGFPLLFSLGCAEVKKTTNEYHVVVDNLELWLVAPSFSRYVDKGPLTPGELAMQGRKIPREYPFIHLALDRAVGRVDLINMRTSMNFTTTEYRIDKPFENWEQFDSWYKDYAREFYFPMVPCEAFGHKGMRLVVPEGKGGDSLRSRESYYFLTNKGAVIGVHFSSYDHVSPVPAKDHERIDALLGELKRGLSIKMRQP